MRTKLNEALKDSPLAKIVISQVVPLPDARDDFKKGQLPFYIFVFGLWLVCRSLLRWGCEQYMQRVFMVAFAEFGLSAFYHTTFGLALVRLPKKFQLFTFV